MKKVTVFLVSVLLFSCGKEKTPEPSLVDTPPQLEFKFNHKAGANSFSFNATYTDDFGTNFKISRASVYISRPYFMGHSSSDTVYKASETYLLVTPSKQVYTLGIVPEGHYHYLTFGIGVDSVANHSDPSTYPAGHALAFQNPSTHWNWNSGYIFTILEGRYDGDGDGVVDNSNPNDLPFSYHIGLDSLYRQQPNLVVHGDLMKNKTTTFNLNIDYLKLVEGIDIKNAGNTHSSSNFALAETVANNSLQMITGN